VANRLSRRLPHPGDCWKYNTPNILWYRDKVTTIGSSYNGKRLMSMRAMVAGELVGTGRNYGSPGAELVWASGLFEGEGCITFSKARPRQVHLKIGMTDEDTVRRFHAAVGGLGRVNGPYWRGNERHSPQWHWQLSAGFEKTQAVIAMLWGGLGERRRARAKEALGNFVVGAGTS